MSGTGRIGSGVKDNLCVAGIYHDRASWDKWNCYDRFLETKNGMGVGSIQKKVLVAGHICIDITPKIEYIESKRTISDILAPGKLIHVGQADIHTGGCVANTGLALSKLGVDVRLIGKIGDDPFGKMVCDIFDKYEVENKLLVCQEDSTSYSAVIAIPGIDRIFLHHSGANDTMTSEEIPDKYLQGIDLLHFGYPTLMRSMFAHDGEQIQKLFKKAKEKNIAVSMDLASVDPDSEAGRVNWETLLQNVLPYVDFFVPSFEELCFMLDREKFEMLSNKAEGDELISVIDWNKDVAPLAKKVLALGCKVVLIKCGHRGMYYCSADDVNLYKVARHMGLDLMEWSDKEGIQYCYKPDRVVSATGAGDTSIAAFLAAMLQGRSLKECVRLAAAEGACCVTEYDALSGLKTLEQLEEKIQSGWNCTKGSDKKC